MPDLRETLLSLLGRLAAAPPGERPALVAELRPLLADPAIPVPVRVSAAARVLRFVPDRRGPVRRVTRALTAGLSPSRGLDRLRQLQNQVEKCAALDALIDTRERRVKLLCPRCRVRLPRVEMVKHLWHEHGLSLERGRTRTLRRLIEDLQARFTVTGEPGLLDRVAALAGPAGLRRWIAGEEPQAEEVAPLLAAAAEHGAGLCPGCFAELPAAVTPLPSPLVLDRGRLAGDGYAVEAGDGVWVRTLRVIPAEKGVPAGRRTLAPRGAATLAAAVVLLVTLSLARNPWVALAGTILALLTYLFVRRVRSVGDLDDRAVNAAWVQLAPRLAERPRAARFLARLCCTSLGRGDPGERVRVLAAIVARAAAKAEESDAELQLLAAASVLQVEDGARFGRDVVAGIATLAAMGFGGERPPDFAEFVVACYLSRDRDPGDLARLRVLLLAAAFEAGLVPRDLLDLFAGAPALKQVMAVEPAHRLALLFGLWRTRPARAWESAAPAETVFDLARTAPPTAARLLARFPDLLLIHRPEPEIDALVGPVLVCGRGVAVGGFLAADPDADVRFGSGRELIFGRHRLDLPRRPPAEYLGVVRGLLRFRAEGLVPFIDGYLAPGSVAVSRRVLGPFCRRCLACGTVSAVTCGAVGRVV
jgi:hypothetical protein